MNIKFIKIIYFYLFVCPLIAIGLTYIIDPLQYRKKAHYSPIYSNQERLQMPTLARTLDYDSIVIGNSHLHNFTPLKVKESLGFQALNLTMSSATLYEQDLLLKIALQRNIVKNVIWGIDGVLMEDEFERIQLEFGPFYAFLYQQPSLLNVVKYVTNLFAIQMTLEILVKYFTGVEKRVYAHYTNDLNTYHSGRAFWSFPPSDTQELKKINEIYSISKKANFDIKKVDDYLKTTEGSNLRKNLERILNIIRLHPSVKFFIFAPPYSIAYFREDHKEEKLNRYLYGQYIILRELLKYENVHLYGFQNNENIILNLNNYKDKTHFLKEISYELLSFIKQNKNRIENENDVIKVLNDICALVNKSNGFDR